MKRVIAVLTAALTRCARGPDRSGTLGQAPTGAPRSRTTATPAPDVQTPASQPAPPPSTGGPAEPAGPAPTRSTGRQIATRFTTATCGSGCRAAGR